MRPRTISEEEFTAMTARVRGQQGKHLPLHGANDEPVPNETGNTVRIPRMAGNKDTASVSLRGESVDALDCAGRGEAYSSEAGRATQLRTKESERSTNAGARPASAPYKSKWEATYASKLELEKQVGIIKAYWYEPFSLWLPGKVRYKPDFLIQYPAGLERSLEIVEVKGWSKNRRDGMTRLKIAAALFPCFVWRLVYRTKGGGWDGEYL